MSSLNETLFEMYLEDEIDVDTLLESVDIDADLEDDEMVEEGANIESTKIVVKFKNDMDALKKDYKAAIKAKNYPKAGDILEKMADRVEDALDDVDVEYGAEEHRFISAFLGSISVQIVQSMSVIAATKIVALDPTGKSATIPLILTIGVTVSEITDFCASIKSLFKGEFTFNSFNKLKQRIVRYMVKYRRYVTRASKQLSKLTKENAYKEVAKYSDTEVSESTEELADFTTTMYIEGALDIDDLDIMEDGEFFEEGGCEKGECYDDAIELLNKLKENPNDKKSKEKLKDLIDDCCDDDDEEDKKEDKDDDSAEEAPEEEETTAEESTITFESEDPIVAEIMESVSEMDHDLKYVDAIMESSIMVTEAPAVMNTVANEIRDRLKNVGTLLGELKKKMVSVKDSKVREKLARILRDLSGRLDLMVKKAKDSIQSVTGPLGKNRDVL